MKYKTSKLKIGKNESKIYVPISLTIPEEQAEGIAEMAYRTDRSRSDMIRAIIQEWLTTNKKELAKPVGFQVEKRP